MKNKKSRDIAGINKYITLLGQLGFLMAGSVFLFFFLGLYIEKVVSFNGLAIIITTITGVLCGFVGVYVLIIRTINEDQKSKKK
jgi:hypothetical protein